MKAEAGHGGGYEVMVRRHKEKLKRERDEERDKALALAAIMEHGKLPEKADTLNDADDNLNDAESRRRRNPGIAVQDSKVWAHC